MVLLELATKLGRTVKISRSGLAPAKAFISIGLSSAALYEDEVRLIRDTLTEVLKKGQHPTRLLGIKDIKAGQKILVVRRAKGVVRHVTHIGEEIEVDMGNSVELLTKDLNPDETQDVYLLDDAFGVGDTVEISFGSDSSYGKGLVVEVLADGDKTRYRVFNPKNTSLSVYYASELRKV